MFSVFLLEGSIYVASIYHLVHFLRFLISGHYPLFLFLSLPPHLKLDKLIVYSNQGLNFFPRICSIAPFHLIQRFLRIGFFLIKDFLNKLGFSHNEKYNQMVLPQFIGILLPSFTYYNKY